MKLIIVERVVKAAVLVAFAICLIAFGRTGQLTLWVEAIEDSLNLDPGRGALSRVVLAVLERLGGLPHTTLIGSGLLAYALLEGTEGVGLHLRRRWAEYLTVLATGLLIPYEAFEVARHPTLFKVGALILNVAVVAYLAWRKRLFMDV